MTALELFTRNNDGDWVGGETHDCIISVKERRSRFKTEAKDFVRRLVDCLNEVPS